VIPVGFGSAWKGLASTTVGPAFFKDNLTLNATGNFEFVAASGGNILTLGNFDTAGPPAGTLTIDGSANAAVLPVPAPASTRTGPSIASTACRCSGFNRAR